MSSTGVLQPFVPYNAPRDCSLGICSANCPQWCPSPYVFSPPPPLGFFSDDTSSSPSLSPLVIALIGILASAALLASYYLFISRYCGGLGSFRRRLSQHDDQGAATDEGSEVLRGDAWQQAPPAAAGGLEEWVIRRIAVCRYKKGDGLVEGSDCPVCLGEFRDGESLRLLPDCCHAFHVACIDTWLKAHSNCPLCRTNVVYTFVPPSPSPPAPPRPASRPTPPPPRRNPPLPEIRHNAEVALDAERGREGDERRDLESGGASVRKGPLRIHGEAGGLDGGHGEIELPEEGAHHDAPRRSSATTTDMRWAAMDGVAVEEVGSSTGLRAEQHACKGGGGDLVLHCVESPAPLKRSFVGGRFCFNGQGKGNHGSILPL